MHCDIDTVRPLAPEEIRPGMHVCVTHEVDERLPYFDLEDLRSCAPQTVRFVRLPTEPSLPLRVVAVCLPFVLAERPDGKQEMLDVRLRRVARLTGRFADLAMPGLRHAAERSGRTERDED